MHFDTFAGCFLNNTVRNPFAGMKNSRTTVISLFLMPCRTKNLINQLFCVFSVGRCPPTIISAITGIYFFVIEMFRLHMTVVCDVFRKILIGTSVFTDEPVITVTDYYLCRGSLYNCRLSTICVQYRVIVAIILKMIVIRYFQNLFIIACRILIAWQRFHLRFVIPKVCIHSGSDHLLKLSSVDVRYYFLRRII